MKISCSAKICIKKCSKKLEILAYTTGDNINLRNTFK